MAGGHRPGLTEKVQCTANDGATVTFSGPGLTLSAVFVDQEDAGYFVVGQCYGLSFVHAGSSGHDGGHGS